jgi:drug/metabolite transporter (DMT)-like permease
MALSSKITPQNLNSYLALGLGTFSLSLAAFFIRWAHAPGIVTGFYRLLFSTLILLPFFARRNLTKRQIRWPDILPPLLGGVCMAINFALWNTSLAYTNVANAAMLGNISPLWVSIGAILLFHEHLKKQFWLGLLTILLGIILIMGGDFFTHPHLGFGDILATSASIFSAAYILITQWGRKSLDSMSFTWINGASACFWSFLIVKIFNAPLTGFPTQTWIVFVAAAIITQIIGYMAISYSLGHLPASIVSPTLNLQPVITIILAIPLLNETPNFIQILGCLLALGGIYLINYAYQQNIA